ncbi:MAG: T9SS type A sorting domain-containing protein [Candidatus Cloacimonetes bacterium]|nr:T9SS type A sorting domain-containing protein [Candidatus Cloacimonadota bacterium]
MNKKILLFVLIILPLLIFGYPQQEWRAEDIPLFETVRADSAHGFDVTRYELYLDVDNVNHFIDGIVIAHVTATEMITEIGYEIEGLTVSEVSVNGEIAEFEESCGYVTIQLGEMETGAEFTTSVSYHGNPTSSPGYGGGMFWNNNYVFTVSDPDASRYWWPCYDHPWDKAIVDLHITIRDDWLVAANGVRTGIENNGDGTNTTHWIGENPMTTYLACFHASNFVEFEQDCTLPNGEDLLIQHFCIPSQLANAQEDFENMPWMIEYFSEIYGMYPFEKFGNCVVPMTIFGGMEHQTMVTLANYLVNGNHTYEMVFAHELAHQWFGDCVAFLDFPHVWLSEGFAVYSEALWAEEQSGYQAMLDYVANDIQGYYLSWSGGSNYTIFNPTFYNYFTPPVYEKAGSVLHMLRMQAGDEQFFEILQQYFATYMHGNAVTSEFQAVVEDVTGEDYEQFFEQWIFGSGIPRYEYAWFVNPYDNIPKLRTYVKTTSTSNTVFEGKAPVWVTYESGAEDSLLVDASAGIAMTERLLNDIMIDEVAFDPDSWLLDRGVTHHSLEITGVYPFEDGAALYWSQVWEDELNVDGYRLSRSENEAGPYLWVSGDLIENEMYVDNGLEVGTTYYYKVVAVIDEEFESEASNVYAVTIEEWPLDQGVLVIDETMDGNGNPGSPTDAMVDEFYAALTGLEVTNYDYASEGAISTELIRNYSTVIWHDEDISQKHFGDNEAVLGSYVYAGGNLLVSGWKTTDDMSAEFLEQFTGSSEYILAAGQEFVGASSEIYNALNIDAAKIPAAFNGHLPYVAIYPAGDAAVFAYEGITGSEYTGQACAVRSSYGGNCFFLGFPLYFCDETEAGVFMEAILAEFEGNGNEEAEIPAGNISLQTYPNPFNMTKGRTGLKYSYDLGEQKQGVLGIYNLRGQKLDEIIIRQSKGEQVWEFQGELSSGIYFMMLSSGNIRAVSKTLIIK